MSNQVRPIKRSKIIWQGIITSILNPKGILFFVAFLPQFVNTQIGQISLQMLLYGLCFTILCLLIYGMIACFAGELGNRLAQYPRIADFMKWLSGSILVGLGLRMVVSERK